MILILFYLMTTFIPPSSLILLGAIDILLKVVIMIFGSKSHSIVISERVPCKYSSAKFIDSLGSYHDVAVILLF